MMMMVLLLGDGVAGGIQCEAVILIITLITWFTE
jgi:hypothetical protein